MSVTIENHTAYIKSSIENNVDLAIRLMLEDIHREANPITPKRPAPVGGTLRTMVLKGLDGPHKGYIVWNAPYAEYQERGYTSGPVTHYSTPGTHAHFAEESVEKVVNRSRDYFVQAGVIR